MNGEADPASTVDRMVALLQRWEQVSDRRAPFLRCYLMMTRNMLATVDRGGFYDAAWVARLVDRFAEYYFDATSAYDSARPTCSAIWIGAHDAASSGDVFIVQRLLLGINAHINYDLVLALADLMGPEWQSLDADRRARRHDDYCTVNAVIAATIDDVQDFVIEPEAPGLDVVDRLLGRVDEWLISTMITRWRERIWGRALEMLESPDADRREAVRCEVEWDALVRADAILLKNGVGSLMDLA